VIGPTRHVSFASSCFRPALSNECKAGAGRAQRFSDQCRFFLTPINGFWAPIGQKSVYVSSDQTDSLLGAVGLRKNSFPPDLLGHGAGGVLRGRQKQAGRLNHGNHRPSIPDYPGPPLFTRLLECQIAAPLMGRPPKRVAEGQEEQTRTLLSSALLLWPFPHLFQGCAQVSR
jgi:hypothetical protein